MADIEITIDEQNTLAFDVEIQGIETSNVDVRFVIETENLNLSFDGKMKDKTVTIDIPILSKIIKPNTYNAKLEFVLEGEKYFAPMTTEIDLVQPVKITAGVKESKVSKTKKNKIDENNKPVITVKPGKTLNEKILDNLDNFASTENLDELLEIYNEKITSEKNIKEALSLIDSVCKNKHGKTFKEYIIEITQQQALKKDKSFYAEWDDSTNAWTVFGDNSGFAYSSWPSEEIAKKEAKKMTKNIKN